MPHTPTTDKQTLEFFKLLHVLLNSHPDKNLVNTLHRMRNAPGVKRAYFEAAWELIGDAK